MSEHEQSKTKFSDEFLNAFIDGQLTPDEKSRALVEFGQDEAVNRQVCELRKVRDLVQLAYAELPVPPRGTIAPDARHRLGLGLAAGIALVVGMVVGWVLHQPEPVISSAPVVTASFPAGQSSAPAAKPISRASASPVHRAVKTSLVTAAAARAADNGSVTSTSPATVPAMPPAAEQGEAIADAQTKILFQVNRGSVAALGSALDDIESLAQFYREHHQNARIEIVINGEGLNLVRTDVTSYADRIQRMQQDYDNITFAACQNTIDRLRREQGIRARLLPGVIVIDSGVAQIMRRQQQGWAYIQV
jgi:hypothetical protein